MKRIGSIILSMLCFFVMTGCQTVQQYPRVPQSVPLSTTETTEPPTESAPETMTTTTIQGPILSAGNRFRTCQHGNAGRSTGTGGRLQIIHAVHRGK